MAALEEIQQAIETLERLKAESTPGPWEKDAGGDNVMITSGRNVIGWTSGEFFSHAPDCDLIVTLHRTIPAQQAILRAAVDHFPDRFLPVEEQREWLSKRSGTRHALELARAINGGT